jgi:tetratricopeptide (TPR) repeat protein
MAHGTDDVDAYQACAQWIAPKRRWRRSTAAQALDPLSLIINAAAGRVLRFARAYDDAIAQYQSALEPDRDFPDAHMNLGLTYIEGGRREEAVRALQHAGELSGRRTLICAAISRWSRCSTGCARTRGSRRSIRRLGLAS